MVLRGMRFVDDRLLDSALEKMQVRTDALKLFGAHMLAWLKKDTAVLKESFQFNLLTSILGKEN